MDELKALAEAIVKNTKKDKTNAYEALATVLRIDGEKVYVHIDGGAPETPATATMACKDGDTVRIHVEGGKAWVIGNVSAPATDDTAAILAKISAKIAQKNAGAAKKIANESAGAVNTMQERMDSGEFKGEDAVTLRVDSSRGTVFKNNSVATVLTVTIYKGGEIITTPADLARVFGAKAALEWHWKGLDDTAWKIISVDDKRLSNGGFSFSLSPEDVTTKVVLECVLNTED